jgi:hypothetical protein
MISRIDVQMRNFQSTRTRVLAIPQENSGDRPAGCYIERLSSPADVRNRHQIEKNEIESVRFNSNQNGQSSNRDNVAICARPGADVYTYFDIGITR